VIAVLEYLGRFPRLERGEDEAVLEVEDRGGGDRRVDDGEDLGCSQQV